MKVNFTKNELEKQTEIVFKFELEASDSERGVSSNGGRDPVLLKGNQCKFLFPLKMELPHVDLLAFAALKIISPYIGDSFSIGNGVSGEFSKYIKTKYKNIINVLVDDNLTSYSSQNLENDNLAVSFSGGVDSVAAAFTQKEGTYLIMSSVVDHPSIPRAGRNTNAHVIALDKMPNTYKKIEVKTDFVFLSFSQRGNWTSYPDTYCFTIPSVLLAEHLKLKAIITGDMMDEFTMRATIYKEKLHFPAIEFFKGINTPIEYPLNGVTELVSNRIAYENGMIDFAESCEGGSFGKPCYKCVKCFRKTLYKWSMFNIKPSDDAINSINNSHYANTFAKAEGRDAYNFAPLLKWAFENIEYDFDGNLKKIKDRSLSNTIDVTWVDKIFPSAYENVSEIVIESLKEIKKYTRFMQDDELNEFKKLDWTKN